MNQTPQTILFTSFLSDSDMAYAKELGLILTIDPYIFTEQTENIEVTSLFNEAKEAETWVFTSKNALTILSRFPDLQTLASQKSIVVAGKKTQTKAHSLGISTICSSRSGAEGVIDTIEKKKLKAPFLYFCGNLRLSILPNYWQEKKLRWNEIITYTTELRYGSSSMTNVGVVVFCSPSAVKSFFKENVPIGEIQYLAIGKTTQKALSSFVSESLISPQATVRSLLDCCNKLMKNKQQ